MKTISETENDDITEQAVSWYLLIYSEEVPEQVKAEFLRWLDLDVRHKNAYDKAERIWSLSAKLPLNSSLYPDKSPKNRQSKLTILSDYLNWPSFAQLACISLLILPFILTLGWQFDLVPNDYQTLKSTKKRQPFTLPDSTVVELNSNTQLSYTKYRSYRLIKLKHGEAYFDVAHLPNQPFVISVGTGQITVTGTRFNVWKFQDKVSVSVSEGSVNVENNAKIAKLSPGFQANFSTFNPNPKSKAVDIEKVLAWRNGLLYLDNLALAEAVPLINRYLTDSHLVINGTEVAKMRIGGYYRVKNINNLVESLTEIFPVKLNKKSDGSIIISKVSSQF